MRQQLKLFTRIFDNILRALTAAYGLNLALFLLLRWTVGERWMLVALFNSFLHVLVLPSLLLLPLFLLRRQWRITLLLIPGVLVFSTSYAGLFLPQAVVVPPTATHLRVLTYNLNKNNRSLTEILSILRDARADLVALQELNFDVAAVLEAELSDRYPYQALYPTADFAGMGVLSRYPIRTEEFWRLSFGHQRLELTIEQNQVIFYNTHPIHPFGRWSFDSATRSSEIAVLLQRATQDKGPVLVVGDFNMTDQAEDYGMMTTTYKDAWQAVGWGLGHTFPQRANVPLLARIDYIFHSADFSAQEAQVWSTAGGSDHRPLWADLLLIGGS